ncbi:MAG: hypothetical protein K0B00_00335 [Rhodobacteraceae bacterium]|nr:hypothetical protein [Paracoccaceae bacterium]
MGAIALMIIIPLLFLGLILPTFGDNDDAPEGEVLDGTEGDDLLAGGAGNDILNGFDGQDTLTGAGGNDTLWAGAGDDGSWQEATEMTSAELGELIFGGDIPALQAFVSGHTSFGADGGAGNDYVNGGPGDDVLTGGAGNDVVRGSSGHDLIIDLEGANTLNGGFGDDDLWAFDRDGTDAPDLLQGWNGDDDLLGDDGDTMEGGEGVDYFFTVWKPGDAPVTITDFDPVAEYLEINTSDLPDDPLLQLVDLADNAGMAVTLNGETMAVLQGVTASQFHAEGEVVENIRLVDRVGHESYAPELAGPGDTEWIGPSQPVYFGSDANDRIVAGDSNDALLGRAGNDTLFGGDGDDDLIGSFGDDHLFAGPGKDYASGGNGNDLIRGGAGADFLVGDADNDTIFGDYGDDYLDGGTGADALFGGFGNDALYATWPDGSPDTLDGGAGDDSLFAYAGSTMTGGTGADLFWSGYDAGETAVSTVTDFTPGEDRIEIFIDAAEVTPGFVVQAMGASDTAIMVDGVTRLILAGITPAQVDPAAISVFHAG